MVCTFVTRRICIRAICIYTCNLYIYISRNMYIYIYIVTDRRRVEFVGSDRYASEDH